MEDFWMLLTWMWHILSVLYLSKLGKEELQFESFWDVVTRQMASLMPGHLVCFIYARTWEDFKPKICWEFHFINISVLNA